MGKWNKNAQDILRGLLDIEFERDQSINLGDGLSASVCLSICLSLFLSLYLFLSLSHSLSLSLSLSLSINHFLESGMI